MPTFAELMELYRNPGEQGLPDTFADDLVAAYREDISVRDAAVAAREAAAQEYQQKLSAAEQEQLRLKAINYDLLVAAPKPGEQENPEHKAGDEPRGVASLFE